MKSELIKELEKKIYSGNLQPSSLDLNEDIKLKEVEIFKKNNIYMEEVRKILCYYIESDFDDYVYKISVNKDITIDEKLILLNIYQVINYNHDLALILISDMYSIEEKIALIYKIIEVSKKDEYSSVVKKILGSKKSFMELLFIFEKLQKRNEKNKNKSFEVELSTVLEDKKLDKFMQIIYSSSRCKTNERLINNLSKYLKY